MNNFLSGSEGFLIVRDNRKKTTMTVDFRGAAPDAASENMFDADPKSKEFVRTSLGFW